MSGSSSRVAHRWATGSPLLALALAAGCGQGGRPRAGEPGPDAG
jgi:hypothetical protein